MIVVIDYHMGNIGSIINMLKKVGVKAVISSEPDLIQDAEKLILPGVGAFDSGMKNLEELGLLPILNQKVREDHIPILGICLGMQLLTKNSEEGTLNGLGWIDAETVRFHHFDNTLKIPHMGWNTIRIEQQNSLFKDMYEKPRFYFVHSYHIVCNDKKNVLATTFYGYEFVSAVAKGNIVGTQFHPEKSHKFGMRVLKNFAEHF